MSNTDFTTGPLADLGVTVVRTPITETHDNISGDETLTEGSTNDVTAVFENANQYYNFSKAGEVKGADARMFVEATETINKNDKITYGGVTYRVDAISTRRFGSDSLYKAVLLFRVT